jgi:PAS domain S-box-containing protein
VGFILAKNPARKVLQFNPGQRSNEWVFADAFDHAPNGMALLDSDGRITQASIALCNLLGFNRAGLIGLVLCDITHSDDVETEAEQRKRLANGEIDRYQLVQRLLRRNGETTWVRLSVAACRQASGFPEYYVLQVESSDAHHTNGNGAAPAAVAHLLGEALHELGNTLTPLMVNTQLIVEQSLPSEISDSANAILKAARRIAFALRRLRGLEDVQSVAYVGQDRMLDLRTVAPPDGRS